MQLRIPVLAFLLALVCACGTALAATSETDKVPAKPVVSTLRDPGGEDRVGLAPIRFRTVEAKPGDVLRFGLRVRNTLPDPVLIEPYAIALQGASREDQFAEAAGDRRQHALVQDWVTFPGFGAQRTLEPGTELRFPAIVTLPADAPPGTRAIGFVISQEVGVTSVEETGAPSTRVRASFDLTSTAVIDIAGKAVSDLRLREVDAPRVVWGGDSPTFSAVVENVGDTELRVDGQVELGSFLSSAGRTLGAKGPDKGYPTLPGGTRKLTMRWADPPLIGWFEPELVVVGGKGSGVRVTDNLDTVYVLPPWWVLVLLAIAIWLPIRARRRRSRDEAWQEHRRAQSRERIEARMRKQEAMRRAEEARRGGRR